MDIGIIINTFFGRMNVLFLTDFLIICMRRLLSSQHAFPKAVEKPALGHFCYVTAAGHVIFLIPISGNIVIMFESSLKHPNLVVTCLFEYRKNCLPTHRCILELRYSKDLLDRWWYWLLPMCMSHRTWMSLYHRCHRILIGLRLLGFLGPNSRLVE